MRISLPLTEEKIRRIGVGDEISISGTIYTARDQAHKKLVRLITNKQRLPIDLEDKIIYYCGPTQTPKGKIIGSCGPTTSQRMDELTPILLKAGLKGMIGKGMRSKEVIKAIKKYKGIYFLTYSGCGALLSKYVKRKKITAFRELGPEAVYELEVKDFPLIVAIDSRGESIYR